MPATRLRGRLIACAAISAYLLLIVGGGLKTWFSGDDVVNIAFLHGYGHLSFPVLAAEAASVFTPEYRPVGGVYYRLLYALFGLNATPYRVLFFALLLTNIALAAAWMRRLSGSGMTAFAGAAVFSYHPALGELYYNDGTIYDVLSLFFLLLLLIAYSKVRQTDGGLDGRRIFQVTLLLGAALGSKEVAASLPGILILYELLLAPPNATLWRRARPILVLTLLTLLCMSVKVFVPNQMSINDLYRPRFDAGFIAHNYVSYHQLLLFDPKLTGIALCLLLAAAAGLALVLRNRVMLFGLLFTLLTLLPVCTLPQRYGFVCYVPLFGYSLYVGQLVSILTRKLTTLTRGARLQQAIPYFAGAVLLVALYEVEARQPQNVPDILAPQQRNLKTLLAAAKSAAPSLPQGSRILLEQDPFAPVAWETLFVLRLGYRNPTLWVDRTPNTEDAGLYALTLRWNGTGYSARTQPEPAAPLVPIGVMPETVRRGEILGLSLPPAYAGCALDVAYHLPDDELARAGIWRSWATLDVAGKGAARINQDAERGRVDIDNIRACGRQWVAASGKFVISP